MLTNCLRYLFSAAVFFISWDVSGSSPLCASQQDQPRSSPNTKQQPQPGAGAEKNVQLRAQPSALSLQLRTVTFPSAVLGREMKYNVIVPKNYGDENRRYPTIYLLHGLMSNYRHWSLMGVPEFAKDRDVIIVMPDAGNSWYVNWSSSEDGHKNQWEDYFLRDVIGHVDANFRTEAKREGRAVFGASMGGFGALAIGLRHPDLFGCIGGMSGVLDFARQAAAQRKAGAAPSPRRVGSDVTPADFVGVPGFATQEERTPRGVMFATEKDALDHDPFHLIASQNAGDNATKSPYIVLDCGTDDPLFPMHQEMVKLLIDKKYPFTFSQAAGKHDPAYWTRHTGKALAVQQEVLIQLLAGNSAYRPITEPAASLMEANARAVKALLYKQMEDWNQKDLDGFLESYWKSPNLVFVSGDQRFEGWENTRKRYRETYQSGNKAMGRLVFSQLEVQSLGLENALARGRWHLTFPDNTTAGGQFTLILRRFSGGWKIVHDHTSKAETKS